MTRRQFVHRSAATLLLPAAVRAEGAGKCYELRIYAAHPGKLDALNARFRDHTCALFKKHGMTNGGYFMPVENAERKLVYFLSYADRAARDASWKAFMADPDWKKAAAASEKDGPLVAKVESQILETTDFSPECKMERKTPERVFEWRTYTTREKLLPNLLERFRGNTCGLFTKHGMTNVIYWTLASGQPGADVTLTYLLAHASAEAAAASFKAFRADPEWTRVREASEKAAGGSLTVADGVKSVMMVPTDYSPLA